MEIDRIKSGCLLYDSAARDWLFFPTSEGRNRYGDGLFFRRFCMDLHTLAGRRQAKAVIASMLPLWKDRGLSEAPGPILPNHEGGDFTPRQEADA